MMKFLIILFSIISLNVFSQDINTRKKHFLTEKGVALSGYDAVAYFQGKPQKGKKEYTYTQEGITYQFASANNLEIFKKNPSKYEARYSAIALFTKPSAYET